MAILGTISEWNRAKGYGYIAVEEQQTQVFFHIHDVKGYSKEPEVSERVTFQLRSDGSGCLRAVNIERPLVFNFALAMVIWFATVVFASIGLLAYPSIIGLLYVLISSISYFAYALDKSASEHGGRRVPNLVFHLLSLLGGWPGALLAQSVLHHKYNSLSFRVIFWATMLTNFFLFSWTLTETGESYLRYLVGSLNYLVY